MLTKLIAVDVDASTFPRGITPPLLVSSKKESIDIGKALVILGQLTCPASFSPASPMRFWAWLRYFAAIATSADLRITTPFIDLDPHQRTILSDDFGVAISMAWLHSKIPGFSEVVDGRRFILHYTSLLRRLALITPKIGLGKAPDYVVRDSTGRWHVLECKGTQKSNSYRDSQLKAALSQKAAISIATPLRGESLAAGVHMTGEHARKPSSLKVVDPEPSDRVVIAQEFEALANLAASTLAISRALALSGFDELSAEVALPSETKSNYFERSLLLPSESRRLAINPEVRWSRAIADFEARDRFHFASGPHRFVGQSVVVDIPGAAFRLNTGRTRIRVKQGIDMDFVQELRSVSRNTQESIDRLASALTTRGTIQVNTSDEQITLSDSNFYRAEVELLP